LAYILLIIFGEKGFPAQGKHGETLGRKASDLSPDSQGYGSKARLPGKYNTLIRSLFRMVELNTKVLQIGFSNSSKLRLFSFLSLKFTFLTFIILFSMFSVKNSYSAQVALT
jgi:hypothetical protein